MGSTNRKLTKVTGGKRRDLFGGGSDADTQASPRIRSGQGRVFVAPEPRDIYLGSQPLEVHLQEAGIDEPLTVRRLLQEQDWSAFESRYATTGRPPYAPSAMMGLVLYGILQGVTSLRGLERLARRDLGCMWVTVVSVRIMPTLADSSRCMMI
ncbi:transposase [Marinobacter sp.]|uniref:transposase n=1 Tax=Marinobacter sp. TaxID=50741 RepID=UPI003566C702